jgi:hypothetical protein
MSKPLLTALAAVFGLSTLAGCHHHNRAETFTPVADTAPIAPAPVHSGKFR